MPRPPRSPRTTAALAAAPALAALAASGCYEVSPFGRSPRDLGRQVPVERLRKVESLDLTPFTVPAREAAAEAAQVESERRRFEGLAEAPLSIEEARVSALRANLDLRAQLVNPEILGERVNQEQARFESAFTTRASYQDFDQPTASALTANQQQIATVEPGVTIPLRTGGTATVSLPLQRSEVNNQFTTLNPAYSADLAFSISQPLLRNAGRSVNAAAIEIASLARQAGEARTKLAVISTLSTTERAYWQLYRVRRELDVTQQQYELASEQLQRAQRQLNAGRVAEIELVRAQAGLAQRLDAIITAQRNVLTQQRELKRLLNREDLPVDGTALVRPVTDPNPVEFAFDAVNLANVAEQGRMELLEIELQLLSDAAQIRVAQNGLLPELDASASYRINGLGPTSSRAFRELRDNRFEDWSVGANLTVPLGNEGARSRLREAILTRLQRLSTKESRRQTIRQDVLDAIDRLESGWQSVLATRQATVLSARSLLAEQRQFDVGNSTSTAVLDAATRLAESQLAEIRAVVDYQLAQTDLALATGTLLGAARVRWDPRAADLEPEDPDAPRVPNPVNVEPLAPPPTQPPAAPQPEAPAPDQPAAPTGG